MTVLVLTAAVCACCSGSVRDTRLTHITNAHHLDVVQVLMVRQARMIRGDQNHSTMMDHTHMHMNTNMNMILNMHMTKTNKRLHEGKCKTLMLRLANNSMLTWLVSPWDT